MIVPASLFAALGGFDAKLISGEDFDFCMRAKQYDAAISIRPELKVVHHDYPLTGAEFVRRERWHDTGDFQSVEKMLGSRVALTAVAFAFLNLAMLAFLPYKPWYTAVLRSYIFHRG